MLHRYRIAFVLMIMAALLLAVGFLSSSLNWWQRDILFTVAIGLAIASQVLYFNVKLNKLDFKWSLDLAKVTVSLPQLPEWAHDDVDDIRKGRLTGTQFAFLSTLTAQVLFLICLLKYHKVSADWYGFNVFLISLATSAGVAWLVLRTEWFEDQSFRTPMWVFLIPLGALIVCVGLGIYMTEPMELGGPTAYQAGQPAQTQEYDYTRTRAHTVYMGNWGSTTTSGSSSSGSGVSCSGKSCGYAVLVLVLIIVVLVLIVCSALVAHFWVLAGFVLITLMVMIAIHELRVSDKHVYRPTYRW